MDNQDKPQPKQVYNKPENELPITPLTLNEVKKGIKIDELENDVRLRTIAREFKEGFDFIEHHKMHINSVTFFGSAVLTEENQYYKTAYDLAKRISTELGYAVATGGGPGIMEAANRGAYDAGGKSFGICINLPDGEAKNPYITHSINLFYFFVRKVILTFAAGAYIYFPGGYGTMDEVFEILTLVKTQKIEPVPVIFFGSEYWKGLDDFINEYLLKTNNMVDKAATELYQITDSQEEVLEIIKNSKDRQ